MLRRLVCLRAALASLSAAASLAACYDVPMPDCGFVCGPGDVCPEGYTCANDHRCHRNGAPANLMCSPPDAAPPIDAPADVAATL